MEGPSQWRELSELSDKLCALTARYSQETALNFSRSNELPRVFRCKTRMQ